MKKLLVILLFATPLACFGQFEFQVQTGYATYRMLEMKDHMKELQADLPVDIHITDNFPGYWYYELNFSYSFENDLLTGLSFGYGSTGGRMHYRDYSGEVSADLLVDGITIAPQLGWRIPNTNRNNIYVLKARVGCTFGDYHLLFKSKIGDPPSEDNLRFRSMNILFEPGFNYTRMVSRVFGVNAYIGMNLNLAKGKLFLDSSDESYLLNNDEQPVTLDWTGLRASLGVTIMFRRHVWTD
jgi:hypothetical protein